MQATLFDLTPQTASYLSSATGSSSNDMLPPIEGQDVKASDLFSEPNLQFGGSFESTQTITDTSATDWLDAFLASNPFPWPTEGLPDANGAELSTTTPREATGGVSANGDFNASIFDSGISGAPVVQSYGENNSQQ